MRLTATTTGRELAAFIKKIQNPIASAATAAVREAAQLVKKQSQTAIASAGFSARSSRNLRYDLNPERGDSIDVSATFKFRTGYFNVFEEGATITGKPLIWLPLETVPFGRGHKRLSPKQYVERLGPLFRAKGTNPPLLVGRVSRAGVTRATTSAVRLRKRAVKSGTLRSQNVPLFVGVSSVRISKKFDIKGIVRRVAGTIPQLYAKNVRDTR